MCIRHNNQPALELLWHWNYHFSALPSIPPSPAFMLKSSLTCNNPLNSDVRKRILIINNCLPVEKASLWVTADEIRDRLVYCGVDHALTADIVSHALKNANRHDIFFKSHRFNNVMYYIPVHHYKDNLPLPNKQQFKSKQGCSI